MALKIEIEKKSIATLVSIYDDKKPEIKDLYLYDCDTDIVFNTRLGSVTIPAPENSNGLKELSFGISHLAGSWASTTVSELAVEFATLNLFTTNG